ncbi:hypothetical protein HK405_011281 [Cladochytrium tenue]|nr:hypothetical protein HK405_011281 [Cladochytrium tenue]
MVDSFWTYSRGFLTGAGFIVIVEVLLVLVVCFFLFDPSRKTVVPPAPEFSTIGGLDEADSASIKLGAPSGNRVHATHSKARDLINEHEEPWPENIVEFLKLSLTPTESDNPVPPRIQSASGGAGSFASRFAGSRVNDSAKETYVVDPVAVGATDPCPWANVVASRFFLALRESELFKSRMKAKMTERMNMKLQNNSFVYAPKIHGVRLMKGVTDDLAVILEVDVTYAGGGSVAIETTLTAGLSIPVRVYLSSLAGKLRVRCPSIGWPDMLAIAFVEDPGAYFTVDSPITVLDNEMVRGMVNKIIAGVMRKVFLDMTSLFE